MKRLLIKGRKSTKVQGSRMGNSPSLCHRNNPVDIKVVERPKTVF
jgi:hypothetical protein